MLDCCNGHSRQPDLNRRSLGLNRHRQTDDSHSRETPCLKPADHAALPCRYWAPLAIVKAVPACCTRRLELVVKIRRGRRQSGLDSTV